MYEESREGWATWEKLVTAIPLSLVIIFIVLGNLLVVVAVLTQKSLRTPSNIYILSLALTDLFVGVFILPFNIIDMIHGWKLGKVLCRIWLTSDVTLCSSSILHISAIAVDRFRSINEGLQYAQSRTKRSSIIICCALWFLAVWIASPPVLGWNDWEKVLPKSNITNNSTNSSNNTIDNDYGVVLEAQEMAGVCMLTQKLGYIVHSATGAFFIPAFVMAGLYIRIYFLLKKKFRERAEVKCLEQPSHDLDLDQSSSLDTGNDSSGDIIEDSDATSTEHSRSKNGTANRSTIKFSKGRRKQSEQITAIMSKKIKFSLTKERKAAKTLGILIGAFLICWTPFTLTYLFSGILPDGSVPLLLFQFVTWLGYVNSGINPVIYTIYSPEFKRAFKKVIFAWRD